MPHPVKQTVQDTLGPYHARIRSIVDRAWTEWREIEGFRAKKGMAPILYSRTVANHVFDAIARFAINEFAADTSVHVRPESQTIKIFFKGDVLGRFKKGDDNKLGQNIPTMAAQLFEDASGIIPGLPPETAKVEFIWLANEIHTRLEHVLVVARDGERPLWDYEIEPTIPGAGTVVLFPAPLPPDPEGGNERLVTPKKPAEKKTKENE
jgi:hypothetical protein